jgi:hypothetical protein
MFAANPDAHLPVSWLIRRGLPWFVMMAKTKKGTEVLLLVDPVSGMAVEIESGPSDAETASTPETRIPKLRN